MQVGTASFVDPRAPLRIAMQLNRLLIKLNIANASDLVGTLKFPSSAK